MICSNDHDVYDYFQALKEVSCPTKDFYCAWYNKYHKAIVDYQLKYKLDTAYRTAFIELENIVEFLKSEPLINAAIERYSKLDLSDLVSVVEWLLDYEKAAAVSDYFNALFFHLEPDRIVNDKIILSKELDIKIELSVFDSFLKFEIIYPPLHNYYKSIFLVGDTPSSESTLQELLEFHHIVDFCSIDVYPDKLDSFIRTINL